MSNTSWIVLGLAAGWATYVSLAKGFGTAAQTADETAPGPLERIVTAIETALAGAAPPKVEATKPAVTRQTRIRDRVAGLSTLLVPLALAAVTIGQAVDAKWAFSVEEQFLEERYGSLLLGYALGLALGAYRSEFAGAATRALRPFKEEGKAASWPLQAGAALFGFLVLLMIVRPGLVDKLVSFKDGDVEAHFSEGSSAIQRVTVDTRDVHRKSTLSNWAQFKLFDAKEPPKGVDPSNARFVTYEVEGQELWRPKAAQALFDAQLNPLFSYIGCFEALDHMWTVENDDGFTAFVLETLIEDLLGFDPVALATLAPAGESRNEPSCSG